MAAFVDVGYKRTVRPPLSVTRIENTNPAPRASGFYELFDTREISFKPSSRHIDGSYGFEKLWRPTRAKVEGAGVSSLGSNLTSLQPEQWRPSIKYIDPGTGTWIYDQPWRSSRKHVVCKHHSGDCETRCTRKKFVAAVKHSNKPEWPSSRARGTCVPRSEWEPPFRKGTKDDLKPIKTPRRHLDSYRDEYESSGVKNVLDPKAMPLRILGKKRLPTYRNEQSSFGVGAALSFLESFHHVEAL